MKKHHEVLELSSLNNNIHTIRGMRVMLDSDLAKLYSVELKRLLEQVKRNLERFPEDFMFQLTPQELTSLRSQIATLKVGRGQHRKYMPYAFTEHGAIMLASVLNSPRAVEASIFVVRAFVRLREVLLTHSELANKLTELERKVAGHDEDIRAIISAIKQLMSPPPAPSKKRIGFQK